MLRSLGLQVWQELLPHLHAERAQHRMDLRAQEADEEVAPGWRSYPQKANYQIYIFFIYAGSIIVTQRAELLVDQYH